MSSPDDTIDINIKLPIYYMAGLATAKAEAKNLVTSENDEDILTRILINGIHETITQSFIKQAHVYRVEHKLPNYEYIRWHHTTEQLPDADTTVLIIQGGDVDAFVGWLDGDQWRFADGMPCDNVLWWAHMPEGPAQ